MEHTGIFFFCSLSFISGSPFFLDFCQCDRFYPTIEVVPFKLCGLAMLNVGFFCCCLFCFCFLFLPALTHPGHECQDLLRVLRWNMCVHRLDLSLYSHPKVFVGMDSEPLLTARGKPPLLEAQRRVGPVTLHQAGQRAQHSTN